MSVAITYRIRQADSSDLAACLDLWDKKVRSLAVGSTLQRVIDQGRNTISSWIEDGVMQLVVTEAGDVVACLSLSGDATGFCTPAELVLISEHSELQHLAGAGAHGDARLGRQRHRSGRPGPLARALREVAATRDDLATARGLSTDDDTFAVEADMLQRRLRELEMRLTTMQASIDSDDLADEAAIWTEAAAAVAQMKLDAAPSGANPWNAALSHAAGVLSDRARAAREASDAAAGARASTTH
jgi:hypothetical protein